MITDNHMEDIDLGLELTGSEISDVFFNLIAQSPQEPHVREMAEAFVGMLSSDHFENDTRKQTYIDLLVQNFFDRL